MIVFNLACEDSHAFEGWFASSDAFERQQARGLLECPMCGTKTVKRMPSAPRLNLGAPSPAAAAGEDKPKDQAATGDEATARAAMLAAQTAFYNHLRQMLEKSDDVGERFAEEARRIHYKETAERQIHGVATRAETAELLDEGIPVLPVPGLKRKGDLN